ncbi:gpB family protein [Rahnella aquatilis CIP 78.65 = ATCC 33071]|uniref:Uncharacterized protein n=1 Tax=Rahnella aquatilis (strain ATCC 33071 / DSM 4594 / JCM 1683 / NBRC 105701 / NCIMB 13365 / CIP 78.65) TaxID=745277 RepID=H2IW08_RAHAC|nr:DUF5347 family protein [Rahnella aquatilis]AEX50677.1 hypothetical protein Rahaq2_0759 [Rahnella aquatilis CIP 78.65 = ATCC 33071]KFD01650.1 gpB family protein [Rahnella aquatilis CIP 78.65 = ATCC 33071]
MFLGTEQQRQTGLRHIAHLKETYFSRNKSRVEVIFDQAPEKWKLTLCFHAGLKRHHTFLAYSQLNEEEQLKITQALLSLRHFTAIFKGELC